MSEVILTRRGGGAKVNGAVRQYPVKSGYTVSKGDFVQIKDDVTGDTPVMVHGNAARTISGIYYRQNRYMALVKDITSPYKAYCIVYDTLSKSVLSTTEFSSGADTYVHITPILIRENRILLLYYGLLYSTIVYALMVSLDTNTPQFGIPLQIVGSTKQVRIAGELNTDGRILCTCSCEDETGYHVRAYLLSINDLTITNVSYSRISQDLNGLGLCKLSTNKFLCLRANGTLNNVVACLLTIEGNTINVGALTDCNIKAPIASPICIAISSNQVIGIAGADFGLYIFKIEIAGSTLKTHSIVEILSSYAGLVPGSVKLNGSKIAISFTNKNFKRETRIYDFSKEPYVYDSSEVGTVSNQGSGSFSSTYWSSVQDNKIMLNTADGTTTPYAPFVYLINTEYSQKIIPATTSAIDGIAKTSGTSGQTIDVYTV